VIAGISGKYTVLQADSKVGRFASLADAARGTSLYIKRAAVNYPSRLHPT
jgi:hypothetical protein